MSKSGIEKVRGLFEDSIDIKRELVKGGLLEVIVDMGEIIVSSLMSGGKLLLCGNGGSAADAQHLAAELLIRLRPKNNREGLRALALAQDTSTITACGNDFGYDRLYERLVKTLANKQDVLVCLSTSGNSKNIILALEAAKELGLKRFGFLGSGGGSALRLCEKSLLVPSNNTGRIQESHITAGHALMEYIEDRLVEEKFLHLD